MRQPTETVLYEPRDERVFTELSTTSVPDNALLVPEISRAKGAAAAMEGGFDKGFPQNHQAEEEITPGDQLLMELTHAATNSVEERFDETSPEHDQMKNRTTPDEQLSGNPSQATTPEPYLLNTSVSGQDRAEDDDYDDDDDDVDSNMESVSNEEITDPADEVPINDFDATEHEYGCRENRRPSTSPVPSTPDLFEDTFGPQASAKKDHGDDDEDDDDGNNSAEETEGAGSAYAFNPNDHSTGCHDARRASTPPLPSITDLSNNKDIGKEPTGRIRAGPDVDRDLSPALRRHFRFHERVARMIPRLPNPTGEAFDWNRRYWIAVLYPEKKAKNATKESDFMWMKGSRVSTVRTVREAFLASTFLAPEDIVILMGYERLDDRDEMRELDMFSDRLVVLRAVKTEDAEHEEKSLVEGIVPQFVDLSDD